MCTMNIYSWAKILVRQFNTRTYMTLDATFFQNHASGNAWYVIRYSEIAQILFVVTECMCFAKNHSRDCDHACIVTDPCLSSILLLHVHYNENGAMTHVLLDTINTQAQTSHDASRIHLCGFLENWGLNLVARHYKWYDVCVHPPVPVYMRHATVSGSIAVWV
jgi:hypothetical protein